MTQHSDDRLIVALDLPNLIQAMALVDRLGDSVSFYKIGLGMLTGGGLALANELKQDRGKRVFLDMKILAVTVLTSLDRADLDANLIKSGDIAQITLERAARALEAGADGVIASPQEAALIRALPQARGKLIVTPGVRPAGAAQGDQKRIATPAQAIADGADHIVVGRPIWQAADPAGAARAIVGSLRTRSQG